MSPPPTPPRRGEVPRWLMMAGWAGAATLVALTKFAPPRRTRPLGPPSGRLTDGLPLLRPAPDSAPALDTTAAARATPPATPPAAAPSPPAGRARPDWRRELPRPFAELRTAATPLIMPRLALPRVLAADFRALRGLAARAKPNQPVQVKLTAYCLRGRTRRGTRTRAGVIAADPRIFPMARHVELFAAGRYLGRFRVEDTGSGVRGPHIDIWTPDCADARRFGTRPGVASLVAFGEE